VSTDNTGPNEQNDDIDLDDDEGDEYDGNDPTRCANCGRTLTDQEIRRHYHELNEWVKKHGTPFLDEAPIIEDSGLIRDCDRCAVERLRRTSKRDAQKTFMDRCIDGGPEGFWLIAVVLLAVMLFLVASNGR
jgi:hypothetical protein